MVNKLAKYNSQMVEPASFVYRSSLSTKNITDKTSRGKRPAVGDFGGMIPEVRIMRTGGGAPKLVSFGGAGARKGTVY